MAGDVRKHITYVWPGLKVSVSTQADVFPVRPAMTGRIAQQRSADMSL
jgi:hypothetical protein